MKSFAYKTYQIVILLPLVVILTIFVFGMVSILCTFFNKDKVLHPMAQAWGKTIIIASLLPVSVVGLERLKRDQQYIYVANHCSYYDVFLLCSFLPFPCRWMMKRELERIPFLGMGSRKAGSIFVDKGSVSAVRDTYKHALHALQEGASLMIFPEGRRSDDGHMGEFSRTPFALACKMGVPVVPITINGAYDVMPRHHRFVSHHHLSLDVHAPITPSKDRMEDVQKMSEQTFTTIHDSLNPQYQ